MLGRVDKTDRGFEIIHFRDGYSIPCSLQQSSLARYEPPGTSAIWLGQDHHRMHLEIEQVRSLVETLQNWLERGTFEKDLTYGSNLRAY